MAQTPLHLFFRLPFMVLKQFLPLSMPLFLCLSHRLLLRLCILLQELCNHWPNKGLHQLGSIILTEPVDQREHYWFQLSLVCLHLLLHTKQVTVFNWLLAISGLSQVFTWSGICLSHVRFRQALKYNNISTDALGYKASTGVWGSYYALVWYALVLISQFWIALFPIGASKPDANNFFQSYLGAIVLVVFTLDTNCTLVNGDC